MTTIITGDILIEKDLLLRNTFRNTCIFLDEFPDPSMKKECIWIYVQLEPEIISNLREYFIHKHSLYDYIITFDDFILQRFENARKYFYGNSWLSIPPTSSRKVFAITEILGNKKRTMGHIFRQAIYSNRERIRKTIPFTIFKSAYGELNAPDTILLHKTRDDKKRALEGFQFHFALENSKQDNYFTEKLIDCLLTKTIPIYYGCSNISSFFDIEGWIILNELDIEELCLKIQSLNYTYYDKYLESIEYNYKKAIEYSNLTKNINKALEKIYESWADNK